MGRVNISDIDPLAGLLLKKIKPVPASVEAKGNLTGVKKIRLALAEAVVLRITLLKM